MILWRFIWRVCWWLGWGQRSRLWASGCLRGGPPEPEEVLQNMWVFNRFRCHFHYCTDSTPSPLNPFYSDMIFIIGYECPLWHHKGKIYRSACLTTSFPKNSNKQSRTSNAMTQKWILHFCQQYLWPVDHFSESLLTRILPSTYNKPLAGNKTVACQPSFLWCQLKTAAQFIWNDCLFYFTWSQSK